MNGAAAYEPLVAEMNQLVDKYNLILAQRQGPADAGDTNEGNTDEGEVNEGGDGEITPNPMP